MKGARLRDKFPDRVPVIFNCHKDVDMERNKFLVNNETTLGELLVIIRKQINLKRSEGLFTLIQNTLPPNTETISNLYEKFYDKNDHILYIDLTKENTFG